MKAIGKESNVLKNTLAKCQVERNTQNNKIIKEYWKLTRYNSN